MTLTRTLRSLAVAALCTFGASSASAAILSVVADGLTAPVANYGCVPAQLVCNVLPEVRLMEPADATGTIEISGTVATLAFHVNEAFFGEEFAPFQTLVTFTDVTYTGTVTVFAFGDGVSQGPQGTGTVSGFANGNPFSVDVGVVNLVCNGISAPGARCGVQFGRTGFNVGGLDYVHTFNITLSPVPEPGAALLLGLALLGLVRRAR